MDWFDLLAVQGTLKSSPTPHFKSINSLTLSLLYGSILTSIHNYWKNHSFDYMDLCLRQHLMIALRSCSKEIREESRYIGVFVGKQTNKQTKHTNTCVQRFLLTTKQTSQINDFSAFLVWKDARVWAH